jgi:hypothetical protein
MSIISYPVPPADNTDAERHRRQIAQGVALLMNGKSNNIIDVTLTANAAATTVSDARIGVTTFPIAVAVTANAAAITAPYVVDSSRVNGSFILVHANDANADKTFKLTLVG